MRFNLKEEIENTKTIIIDNNSDKLIDLYGICLIIAMIVAIIW